jgi:branched-subunit amino acid permease
VLRLSQGLFEIGLLKGYAEMEVFGIIGFVFGIMALSAARTAHNEITKLRNEIDDLKAELQARNSGENKP